MMISEKQSFFKPVSVILSKDCWPFPTKIGKKLLERNIATKIQDWHIISQSFHFYGITDVNVYFQYQNTKKKNHGASYRTMFMNN